MYVNWDEVRWIFLSNLVLIFYLCNQRHRSDKGLSANNCAFSANYLQPKPSTVLKKEKNIADGQVTLEFGASGFQVLRRKTHWPSTTELNSKGQAVDFDAKRIEATLMHGLMLCCSLYDCLGNIQDCKVFTSPPGLLKVKDYKIEASFTGIGLDKRVYIQTLCLALTNKTNAQGYPWHCQQIYAKLHYLAIRDWLKLHARWWSMSYILWIVEILEEIFK